MPISIAGFYTSERNCQKRPVMHPHRFYTKDIICLDELEQTFVVCPVKRL